MTSAEFLNNMLSGFQLRDGEAALVAQPTGRGYRANPLPASAGVLDAMTHFSIGTFAREQDDGRFRRLAQYWTGGLILPLDDIGTKVTKPPELTPTYRIETSPGNEQWGYVFERVERSAARMKTMLASVSAAGITDPGIRQIGHLIRPPGSLPPNKKHAAVLVEWTGRRFNPSTLLDVLGVPERAATEGGSYIRWPAAEGVVMPPDPLAEWLWRKGWVLVDLELWRGPWLPIRCPWAHEHSKSQDGEPDLSGTAYRPASVLDVKRGFRCHHVHCAERGLRDFLAELTRRGAPRVRPVENGMLMTPEVLELAYGFFSVGRARR